MRKQVELLHQCKGNYFIILLCALMLLFLWGSFFMLINHRLQNKHNIMSTRNICVPFNITYYKRS